MHRHEISLSGDSAVLHHQNGFDEASHSRCSFSVSDVPLYGGKMKRLSSRLAAKHLPNSLVFERITNGRARAMSFNVSDVLGSDTSCTQELAIQRRLRWAVGNGDGHLVAALSDRGGENRA